MDRMSLMGLGFPGGMQEMMPSFNDTKNYEFIISVCIALNIPAKKLASIMVDKEQIVGYTDKMLKAVLELSVEEKKKFMAKKSKKVTKRK